MKNDYQIKIAEYQTFFEYKLNSISTQKEGLYGGNLGITLLNAVFLKNNPQHYLTNINQLYRKAVQSIGNENGIAVTTSISRGFAGLGIVDSILNNNNLTLLDNSEKTKLNIFLAKSIIPEAKKYSLDFTHSSIGAAYYLAKYGSDDESVLENLKEFIRTIPIESTQEGIRAKNLLLTNNDTTVTAFSFAHGMCGIISCCLEIYKLGIEQDYIRKIVSGFIKYILSFQLENFDSKIYCQFPKTVYDNNARPAWYTLEGSSPDGWCMGDLIIGYVILKAGVVLGIDAYIKKTISIISTVLERRDFTTHRINHYSFCHGSVGIYWLLKKCFDLESNNVFYEGSMFWLEKTMELLAEHLYNEEDNFNLLTGWGGVALVFDSTLSSKQMEWDNIYGI